VLEVQKGSIPITSHTKDLLSQQASRFVGAQHRLQSPILGLWNWLKYASRSCLWSTKFVIPYVWRCSQMKCRLSSRCYPKRYFSSFLINQYRSRSRQIEYCLVLERRSECMKTTQFVLACGSPVTVTPESQQPLETLGRRP